MIALLLAGCAADLVGVDDDAGSWLRIIGPVGDEVAVTGVDTTAAVAWVWSVDGELCAAEEPVPFEPQVRSYAIEVGGPPDPGADGTCVPSPDELAGGAVAIGVPVLLEPTGGAVALRLDPSLLYGWWRDGTGELADAVRADGAAVAGATVGYTLVAVGDDGMVGDCGLGALEPGFTLYARPDASCGPWASLADPGERAEFQGVAMEPLP